MAWSNAADCVSGTEARASPALENAIQASNTLVSQAKLIFQECLLIGVCLLLVLVITPMIAIDAVAVVLLAAMIIPAFVTAAIAAIRMIVATIRFEYSMMISSVWLARIPRVIVSNPKN